MTLREWNFAAALAAATGLVVKGFFEIGAQHGWIAAGVAVALGAYLVLVDDGAPAPTATSVEIDGDLNADEAEGE